MVSMGMKMRALVPLLPSCPILLTTPMISKRMPLSRMVEPTAGRPGKMFFSSSQPTTATRRVSRVVFVVEPAAGLDGHIADLVVLGSDAEDLAVGRAVIADRANVFAIQHRRHELQRARLAPNGEVIAIRKMVGAAGLRAAFDGRNASGEGEHDVLAEVCELAGSGRCGSLRRVQPAAAASRRPRRCRTWSETSAVCAPTGWLATGARFR